MARPRALFFLLIAATLTTSRAFAGWQPNGVGVCTEASYQTTPVAVSDGEGGAIVVWIDGRSFSWDVYAQRVDAHGNAQWTPGGVAVCTAYASQDNVDVIPDGEGGAVMTWIDRRSGVEDIYAQRVSSSGQLLWTSDGVPVCIAAHNQLTPTICSDGAGGFVVTWSDRRTLGPYDIYIQRLDPSGTPLWTTDGVAVCLATQTQIRPHIVASPGGSALVVWEDGRPSVTSQINDIYAQLVDASGVGQWISNGVPLCTASQLQEMPLSIPDGAGGAIATWTDWRNGSHRDIYAQRVDQSGAVQWTANGVPVCVTPDRQQWPRIVPDDAGGAIIAWEDARDGARIRAQRIDASGAPLWAATGMVLADAIGVAQYGPDLARDGSGGAVVSWSQVTGDLSDVFSQRVDALGTRQWAAEGVGVCLFDSSQGFPAVVTNGDGGAIIAWWDGRNDVGDIYALWLASSGEIPTGVPAENVPSPVALTPGYPNPFARSSSMTLDLIRGAPVTMDVFDVRGQRVRRLGTRFFGAGAHTLDFDGTDDTGRKLPSGVYFCRVTVNSQTLTRKMVISR